MPGCSAGVLDGNESTVGGEENQKATPPSWESRASGCKHKITALLSSHSSSSSPSSSFRPSACLLVCLPHDYRRRKLAGLLSLRLHSSTRAPALTAEGASVPSRVARNVWIKILGESFAPPPHFPTKRDKRHAELAAALRSR